MAKQTEQEIRTMAKFGLTDICPKALYLGDVEAGESVCLHATK
jgi:hypothetical protein